ncbi:hypothetical protein [Dyella japonica]|uniref:hypothetical protein n=1 Tax=Dyella japonica TaxID=231455 RepID=UPI0011869981|nr:hypothetical protein [Dyella japonica]
MGAAGALASGQTRGAPIEPAAGMVDALSGEHGDGNILRSQSHLRQKSDKRKLCAISFVSIMAPLHTPSGGCIVVQDGTALRPLNAVSSAFALTCLAMEA